MNHSSFRRAGFVSVAFAAAVAPHASVGTLHLRTTAHTAVVAPSNAARAALRRVLMVPGFSRQTGLPCNSCHFQFPQLTPFGRQFKLNGYTMSGLKAIQSPVDSTARKTLALSPISPLSAMLVTSLTRMEKAVGGTQNVAASFPQQASIFLAAALTPKVGIFAQFTYAGADGKFGVDNVDLRYADHTSLAGHDLLYGVTLHNNPTVQDVFNTAPAWSWPFIGAEGAPSPKATPLIRGGLGQSVAGLGVYSLFNNQLYTEVTVYRSAQQGAAQPPDSSSRDVVHNVAPYGRVVYTHDIGPGHLSVGAFGMDTKLFVAGANGATDRYTDVGADLQYESHVTGEQLWILRSAFTHERQKTDAAFLAGEASVASRSLDEVRISATYMPSGIFGFTAGGFATTGTADALHYAEEAVNGSRTGSPKSSGALGEIVFNPWQNFRLGLQYTRYFTFNGASSNYDGAGRSASDNSSLFLYSWIAF